MIHVSRRAAASVVAHLKVRVQRHAAFAVLHLRLDYSKCRALRVNQNGDASHIRHIKRLHHDFAAKLGGFFGRGIE